MQDRYGCFTKMQSISFVWNNDWCTLCIGILFNVPKAIRVLAFRWRKDQIDRYRIQHRRETAYVIFVRMRCNHVVQMIKLQCVSNKGIKELGGRARATINNHGFSVTANQCCIALPHIKEIETVSSAKAEIGRKKNNSSSAIVILPSSFLFCCSPPSKHPVI